MLKPRTLLISFLWITLVSATGCDAQPKVTITTKEGREVVFQVEIADTPTKREMGLQYRRDLAEGKGMIFLFPSESLQSFWMKNTPIALDMIFISGDRKIVGIVEQTAPFSLDPRSVNVPSQYVLEINGGLSKRRGIGAGDTVRFDDFPKVNLQE